MGMVEWSVIPDAQALTGERKQKNRHENDLSYWHIVILECKCLYIPIQEHVLFFEVLCFVAFFILFLVKACFIYLHNLTSEMEKRHKVSEVLSLTVIEGLCNDLFLLC